MKIDKAIEIKQDFLKEYSNVMSCDEVVADHLSIEAMKRIKKERTGYEIYAPDLLPGETGE